MPKPELSDIQKIALDDFFDDSVEICYDGGGRAGKSHLICYGIAQYAYNYPGSKYLIARLRNIHLWVSIWKQTLLPILNAYFPKQWTSTKHPYIISFKNGSEIYGLGLDDTTERITKVMGTEFAMGFVNEGTEITYDIFQSILTRIVQDAGVPNKLFIDCNPQNQFHWIHRYFIDRLDPNTLEKHNKTSVKRRGPWLPKNNPYLSKQGQEIYENFTGTHRERMTLGLWVSREGLVFDKYEDALVEPFKIPKDWKIEASVDFGYSNPFAVGFFAEHYAGETWYLFDEYYVREMIVSEHCKALKIFSSSWREGVIKPERWIADHDAEDRATMSKEGIITIPAKKEIISGIDNMRKMMAAKKGWKLRIFNTCTYIISELSGYKYPEKKFGDDRDEKPVKGNDHAIDNTRYFCADKQRGTAFKNFGRLRTR